MTKAKTPPKDTQQLTNIQRKQLLIDAIPESTRAAGEKEYSAAFLEALIESERKDKREGIINDINWLKSKKPNDINEMAIKDNLLNDRSAKLAKIDGNQTEDDIGNADNPQTLTASNYIQQQRADGEIDEVIAYRLHDKNGRFKLTNANIASLFGLDNGLNNVQFDALKQRGKRLCDKGKNILMNR